MSPEFWLLHSNSVSVASSGIYHSIMDPTTVAIIAVLVAAASEIVALSPLKENSLAQVVLSVLLKVFPRK